MDIYFKSVGRGTPLLLNIPPNKEGNLQMRMYSLEGIQSNPRSNVASDFWAKGATVTASSTRQNHLYKESHPKTTPAGRFPNDANW